MRGVDADLPPDEYERLLDEVREYLPAYLSGAATVRRDVLADVKGLLRLKDTDLRRLVAVHSCFTPAVERFAEMLRLGTRRPVVASTRTASMTQTVRGAIDWGPTVRARAQAGNDRTRFAVRVAEPDLDTPENTVLAWVLEALSHAVRRAGGSTTASARRDDPGKWQHVLNQMAIDLLQAKQQLAWLSSVPARRPTTQDLRRLAASRSRFHRLQVAPAARALLKADEPDPQAITDILCRMYFEPGKASELYELVVALRLARELDKPEHALQPRPARLIRGASGVGAYATYEIPHRGTIALTYQGWPKDGAPSWRTTIASRHGLKVSKSRPDILVIRRDAEEAITDVLVLELKASRDPSYLMGGLAQLLGYLGEYPWLFPRAPAAWLVAPPSPAFEDGPIDDGPLWIVSANEVARAVADRMLS